MSGIRVEMPEEARKSYAPMQALSMFREALLRMYEDYADLGSSYLDECFPSSQDFKKSCDHLNKVMNCVDIGHIDKREAAYAVRQVVTELTGALTQWADACLAATL